MLGDEVGGGSAEPRGGCLAGVRAAAITAVTRGRLMVWRRSGGCQPVVEIRLRDLQRNHGDHRALREAFATTASRHHQPGYRTGTACHTLVRGGRWAGGGLAGAAGARDPRRRRDGAPRRSWSAARRTALRRRDR